MATGQEMEKKQKYHNKSFLQKNITDWIKINLVSHDVVNIYKYFIMIMIEVTCRKKEPTNSVAHWFIIIVLA